MLEVGDKKKIVRGPGFEVGEDGFDIERLFHKDFLRYAISPLFASNLKRSAPPTSNILITPCDCRPTPRVLDAMRFAPLIFSSLTLCSMPHALFCSV
jgi:hypothetical protein